MNDYDFEFEHEGTWRIKVISSERFLISRRIGTVNVWTTPLGEVPMKNMELACPEWRSKLIKAYNDYVAENILLK